MLRRALELGKGSDRNPAGVGVWMINFEEQRAIGLDDERSGSGRRAPHQPSPFGACNLGGRSVGLPSGLPLGVSFGASDSESVGVGLGSTVGSGVGSGVGLVTRTLCADVLRLPAASNALSWITCCPISSLNHFTVASVCAVVATAKPSSQRR